MTRTKVVGRNVVIISLKSLLFSVNFNTMRTIKYISNEAELKNPHYITNVVFNFFKLKKNLLKTDKYLLNMLIFIYSFKFSR